jgi:hypothetical protein
MGCTRAEAQRLPCAAWENAVVIPQDGHGMP